VIGFVAAARTGHKFAERWFAVQSLVVDQKEEEKRRSAMSGAAAGAAAPYWRNAGMTYISYANTCAAMVRNCLKEPHKTKALNREQVYYKLQTYQEGEPQKPGTGSRSLSRPRSVGFLVPAVLVVWKVD